MEPRIDVTGNAVAGKFMRSLNAAGMALMDSKLPKPVQELVKLRASQLNGCSFCTDMHVKEALRAGEDPVRLTMVAAWREAVVFTEAERAALALTEEATRLADSTGVSDATWDAAAEQYDEDQLVGLIGVIAAINAYNRINALLRTPGGTYRAGQFG